MICRNDPWLKVFVAPDAVEEANQVVLKSKLTIKLIDSRLSYYIGHRIRIIWGRLAHCKDEIQFNLIGLEHTGKYIGYL